MEEFTAYEDDLPLSFRATCSCGETALIVWAKALGRYVTEKEGWVKKSGGTWSCGKSGHKVVALEIVARGQARHFASTWIITRGRPEK